MQPIILERVCAKILRGVPDRRSCRIVLLLDDELLAEAPATDGPIVGWQFSVGADANSAFYVSVDDPKVTYTDGDGE